MIKCKKCGYLGDLPFVLCPSCAERLELTDRECGESLSYLRSEMKAKRYENAIIGYRALAELSVTEAMVEYARLLEAGELLPKNLDLAMKFFARATEKRDAYAAFRYSRLLTRESDVGGVFYLEYSAYLGCKDAYPAVAAHLSGIGDEITASYYYSLCAELDDTASIVTMAKRFYSGIGLPESPECAKWYMDKLLLPPFHAIKLAYKLRSVKAREPIIERPRSVELLPMRLANEAKRYGFRYPYHHLTEILSKSDNGMLYELGVQYAEGIGCEISVKTAVETLERAAAHGSADAYKYLGDMYISGESLPRDIDRALECYKAAARLGMNDAYEIMGDVFYDGKLVRCDIAAAIKLYDIAAEEGALGAREKSLRLKREREGLYNEGIEESYLSEERGFRAFAISAGMGYLPAYSKLAECYLHGRGVELDRRRAFTWYDMAVEEGDESALYDLALCYSRGIGVAFNFTRACELLERAAARGDERAASELELLHQRRLKAMSRRLFSTAMRLIYKKKFEAARRMLEVCLKAEHPKGIYTLGCMYEFGIGTATDRTLAFSLYETAYALRFRDPRQVYKLRVLKMVR